MDRATKLALCGQSLLLPCFFPSISSVKTNFRPSEYLSIVVGLREPQFLVSALDLFHANKQEKAASVEHLAAARSSGSVVLLDSGNYESYWKHDRDWTPDKFAQVLEEMFFPISFCFDDQDPPNELALLVAGVEVAVLRDQTHSKHGTVLPIVHARTELLPQAVAAVANRLHPLMIAVPERELGEGLIARGKTVVRIRAALDAVDGYVPLHLLGTGNPRSILVYVACGADSFDGLEWCQTAVDFRAQGSCIISSNASFSTTDVRFANPPTSRIRSRLWLTIFCSTTSGFARFKKRSGRGNLGSY